MVSQKPPTTGYPAARDRRGGTLGSYWRVSHRRIGPKFFFPKFSHLAHFASMTSLRRRRGKKGTHIVHGAVPPSQCGSNISFNMFKSKTGVAETKEARFMALVGTCVSTIVPTLPPPSLSLGVCRILRPEAKR